MFKGKAGPAVSYASIMLSALEIGINFWWTLEQYLKCSLIIRLWKRCWFRLQLLSSPSSTPSRCFICLRFSLFHTRTNSLTHTDPEQSSHLIAFPFFLLGDLWLGECWRQAITMSCLNSSARQSVRGDCGDIRKALLPRHCPSYTSVNPTLAAFSRTGLFLVHVTLNPWSYCRFVVLPTECGALFHQQSVCVYSTNQSL